MFSAYRSNVVYFWEILFFFFIGLATGVGSSSASKPELSAVPCCWSQEASCQVNLKIPTSYNKKSEATFQPRARSSNSWQLHQSNDTTMFFKCSFCAQKSIPLPLTETKSQIIPRHKGATWTLLNTTQWLCAESPSWAALRQDALNSSSTTGACGFLKRLHFIPYYMKSSCCLLVQYRVHISILNSSLLKCYVSQTSL